MRIDDGMERALYDMFSDYAAKYRRTRDERLKDDVKDVLRLAVPYENARDRYLMVFETMCKSSELAQECGRCRSDNNGCAASPKDSVCSFKVVHDVVKLAVPDFRSRVAVLGHYFAESSRIRAELAAG